MVRGLMSASLVGTFRALAYNNAWANHRLIGACRGMTEAEFHAPRVGFFPSLAATFNHILVVDRFYVDALEGGSLGFVAFADEIPCKTPRCLLVEQHAVDARLTTVCEALTDASLSGLARVSRGERVQSERRDRLLLHLFQHQIHHRGQAHAMLAGTTVSPPQLDEFFSAGEAPLRADEFAELGWTEAAIWGG